MPHRFKDKQRVLDVAHSGGNWSNVATILSVPHKTAWQWIDIAEREDCWTAQPSARGGKRYEKVSANMIAYIIGRIEKNRHLTLNEMVDALLTWFGVQVCKQTIKNKLDGCSYTMKKIHQESEDMNKAVNKEKRSDYVQKLLQYISQGKKILYVDETNFNTWCSRTRGRSKSGTRAKKVSTASKGANMHVIACISCADLEYSERRFGSYDAEECKSFLRRLLTQFNKDMTLDDVVVVLDNAPAHSQAEHVFGEPEFVEASLLRLGPYSPMLNPIENCFSALKAEVKKFSALNRQAILRRPANMTIKDHRQSFLVSAADLFLESVVDARLCSSCALHTSTFHTHTATLMMLDMPAGK